MKILICCLITACSTSGVKGLQANNIIDTLTVKSETVFFTSDDSVCSVSIIYPVLSGINNNLIEEKVNSFLKLEFLDSPEWLSIDDCDHETGFIYESDYNVKFNSTGFASIQQFIYEYTGGAHGNYSLYSYNIDLSNGELITLTGIIETEKLPELRHISEKKLLEDFDASTLVEAGLFEDSLSILPEQDFYVIPGFLVLQFDPYEIASYAMGEIEIKIPFTKIKELLKPDLPFQVEYE